MATQEFLKAFEKTSDNFLWKYVDEKRIRGFLKSDTTGREFDPIEATLFEAGQGVGSVGMLGLSPLDREAIADAANCSLWKSVDGRAVLDGYAAWIRYELTMAVGLEPDDVASGPPSRTVVFMNGPATLAPASALDLPSRPQPV